MAQMTLTCTKNPGEGKEMRIVGKKWGVAEIITAAWKTDLGSPKRDR